MINEMITSPTLNLSSSTHLSITLNIPHPPFPPSPLHPLDVDRAILLTIDPLIRSITFLNLPPNLLILLYISLWSRQFCGQLIPANHNRWIRLEEAIDILQSTIGGFGVEEVGDWDEGEADACLWVLSVCVGRGSRVCREEFGVVMGRTYPDDPEFVA